MGPTWDHFGTIFLSFWATSPTHSSTRQPTQPSTNETFNQPSLQTTKPSTNQVFNQPSLQPTKPSTNQPFNQPSLQPTKSSISFARLLPIIESSLGLDNSANYGLKRMADDRVDMSTILQREHATWNATMTVTMSMLMIMTMTMNMTMTMTMNMTTFARCHCHSHSHMLG